MLYGRAKGISGLLCRALSSTVVYSKTNRKRNSTKSTQASSPTLPENKLSCSVSINRKHPEDPVRLVTWLMLASTSLSFLALFTTFWAISSLPDLNIRTQLWVAEGYNPDHTPVRVHSQGWLVPQLVERFQAKDPRSQHHTVGRDRSLRRSSRSSSVTK